MSRALVVVACLGVAIGSTATAGAQRGAPAPGAQAILRSDLDGMTARLGGGRAGSREAIADAQRLVAGYRSLGPRVRTLGPSASPPAPTSTGPRTNKCERPRSPSRPQSATRGRRQRTLAHPSSTRER